MGLRVPVQSSFPIILLLLINNIFLLYYNFPNLFMLIDCTIIFLVICVMCLCYLSMHLSWAIFNRKGNLLPTSTGDSKRVQQQEHSTIFPWSTCHNITSILVLWDSFGFYEPCYFTLVQFTKLLLLASFPEANYKCCCNSDVGNIKAQHNKRKSKDAAGVFHKLLCNLWCLFWKRHWGDFRYTIMQKTVKVRLTLIFVLRHLCPKRTLIYVRGLQSPSVSSYVYSDSGSTHPLTQSCLATNRGNSSSFQRGEFNKKSCKSNKCLGDVPFFPLSFAPQQLYRKLKAI